MFAWLTISPVLVVAFVCWFYSCGSRFYLWWSSLALFTLFIMDTGPTLVGSDLDEDILDLSVNDPEIAAFNETTLIGFLVSDKLVNFKAIKAILLGVWDFGSKIQITYLGRNKFAVSYQNEGDKDRVLEACSWAIKGHFNSKIMAAHSIA